MAASPHLKRRLITKPCIMQTPSPLHRVRLRITRDLWQLPPADRQQFLWEQLCATVQGNGVAIGRLITDLGLLLDQEHERLLARRKTPAKKKGNTKKG